MTPLNSRIERYFRTAGISLCFTLFLLTILISFSDAKLVRGTTRLDSYKTEQYLGKFSFSSAIEGTVEGIITPNNRDMASKGRLLVSIYDQAGWDEFHRQVKRGSLCTDRLPHDPHLKFALGGQHSLTFKHVVHSPSDIYNMYVVASACHLEDFPSAPVGLSYELTFKNGGSHLPQDEHSIPSLLGLYLLIIFIGWVTCCYCIRKEFQRLHQIHLVQLLIGITFSAQMIALLCELLHLWVYSVDGLGLKLRHTWLALDVIGELSQLTSQIILTFIFLSISLFGWLFRPDSTKMVAVLKKQNVPFFVFVFIVHVYLEYKGRRYEEDFNFFGDYSHWPGMVLFLIRLLNFLLFNLGLISAYSHVAQHILHRLPLITTGLVKIGIISQQNVLHHYSSSTTTTTTAAAAIASHSSTNTTESTYRVDNDTNQVLLQVLWAGIIWFLSVPFAVILAYAFFQPTSRRFVVLSISLAVHIATLFWLLFTFLRESYAYRLSSLSSIGTIFGSSHKSSLSEKICID